MSKTDIRLGSLISFDSEREADIIEFVQDLTSQHKLGRFIGYLLRLACETPETLQYREKLNPILKEMNDLGITPRRDAMFKQFSKEILDLKNKINDIYVISEKLYTLALARKALGLEDRAKELLAAQFVVRRQTALLESKLGTSSLLYTYESDSMRDVQKKADEILEVILETYGDLLNDVKVAGAVGDVEAVGAVEAVETVGENSKVGNNSSSKLDSDSINRLAEAIEKLCDSGIKFGAVQNVAGNSVNSGEIQVVGEGKPWPNSNTGVEVDTSVDGALGKKKAEANAAVAVEKKKDDLTDLNDSPFDSDPGDEEISFDDFNASSDLLNMLGDL